MQQEIIEQLKNGSQKSFAEIYKINKVELIKFVTKKINNTNLYPYKKDIVQDVFLQAQRKIHLYNEQENKKFISWLLMIAKNHIINLQLKIKKNTIVDINNINELNLIEHQYNAEECIFNFERSQSFNYLLSLNSLSVKQKKVAQMRYIEEMEYKAIADELQIPLGSISKILSLTHSKIKKELLNKPFIIKSLQYF